MTRRWTQEEYAALLCRSHAAVASETPHDPSPRTVARQLKVGRQAQQLEGLALLLWQLEVAGAPAPEREVEFHEERLWRADLCWRPQMLIMEFEGAVHTGGRHTRGVGFENDVEKYNAATLLGYRVLRATASTVKSGAALQATLEALSQC